MKPVALLLAAALVTNAFAAPEPKRDAPGAKPPAAATATVTVEFAYRPDKKEADAVREVTVAGDFNRWNAFSHPLAKGGDGTFRAKLRVPSGTHEWRIVINGSWVHDMQNVAGRCTPTPTRFSAAQDGGQNALSEFR